MMRAKIATCALLLACSVQLNAASLPGQGASMSQVEQDFGSPLSKTGPVGTPPITRWTYDGFVVVFERSKVVHSMSVTGQQPARRPTTPVRAPAPTAAPVQKAATPAATPVTPAQADGAEQARRQAERDAARARADADAAKARAAQEADAAEALRKPVEAAPEAATPQAAPAPATAKPAPEAAAAPKRTAEDALKAAPGFSFDPATGRVILK